MPWWFTPDVSGWVKSADESVGLRPKQWVIDPTGTEWLRKEPLPWRPNEIAVEALTLELARRCGYPAAYGTCCTWMEGGTEKRGFVSRKFQDAMESQTSGGELVAHLLDLPSDLSSADAERARRIGSSLTIVRTALEEAESRYNASLILPFLRMLIFDAWIGNGDRHSANWAILVRSEMHGSACRLAPMYDTAGSLLANLDDGAIERKFRQGMEADALARFVAKCPSGFGDAATRPGIPQHELLRSLQVWPEWGATAPGLVAFFCNNFNMVDEVLDPIPASWLSERRRQLIRQVLEERVKMLQGLLR